MQTIVYTPGVWDLLHVGHVRYLKMARALGDKLIVGVPSDAVVIEDKGKAPVIPLEDRLTMLSALRCVDLAVPYHKLEFLTHLQMFNPHILAVGEMWGNSMRHLDAQRWIHSNSRQMIKIPYYSKESSTNIKNRIRNVI